MTFVRRSITEEIDAVAEERHVVGVSAQDVAEDALQEVLRQVGEIAEVREGDLRLDHPELGEMPAGVGVLRPEGRSEGVDLAHGQAVGLDVELPRYGEKRVPAEEIFLFEGGTSPPRTPRAGSASGAARFLVLGGVIGSQGGYPKQFAGAFAVARRDDGRVHPDEAVCVEVAVHRLGNGVAYPGDGSEGVGARPQVGDGAQVLEGVALLGDGVGFRVFHVSDDVHLARLDFPVLPLAGGLGHRTGHDHGAAGAEFDDLVVVGECLVRHHLQVGEAGAVVDGDERETAAGGAPGLHPAADFDLGTRRPLENGPDGVATHGR